MWRFSYDKLQLWKMFSFCKTFMDFVRIEDSLLIRWRSYKTFNEYPISRFPWRFFSHKLKCERNFHFTQRFRFPLRFSSDSLQLWNTFSSLKTIYKFSVFRFPWRRSSDKLQLWKKFYFHTILVDFSEYSLLTHLKCERFVYFSKIYCKYPISRFPWRFSSDKLQLWKKVFISEDNL